MPSPSRFTASTVSDRKRPGNSREQPVAHRHSSERKRSGDDVAAAVAARIVNGDAQIVEAAGRTAVFREAALVGEGCGLGQRAWREPDGHDREGAGDGEVETPAGIVDRHCIHGALISNKDPKF